MGKRERQQGELESQVMDVIWGAKSELTSQQILDEINRTGVELALTTILTVLSRLVDKGLVIRDSSGGRTLKFSASETRERHNANLMLKLLRFVQHPHEEVFTNRSHTNGQGRALSSLTRNV